MPADQELLQTARLRIANMDCATEEAEIRKALDRIDGIRSLRFQLAARTLEITASEAGLAQAVEAIRGSGFKPETLSTHGSAANVDSGLDGRRELLRLVAALVLAMLAEGVAYFGGVGMQWRALEILCAVAAIALSGLGTYKKGISALAHFKLNISALMAVAVTGALLIGQWPEAAMVMTLYAIAELIEARAVDRARNAIQGLLQLTPETAEVRQPDGSWASQPVKAVPLKAIFRVAPGGRLPLDGVVSKGSGTVNQAPITGESLPVDKNPGDVVYAGTINEQAELEISVTAAASDTTLARIIHAVEQAQGTRAPTQRIVDRFAAFYTPSVFVLALVVAIGAPLLLDWTWLAAAYKALVLLVVACPCALVIATPVSVVSALARAAKWGVLIKGGTYVEEARKIRFVALDKTGTITAGRPTMVAFEVLVGDPDHVVRLAASLASRSDHPVSKAIAQGLNAPGVAVEQFQALAGRGTRGSVEGKVFHLGNHRLVEELGLCSAELELKLQGHEAQGRTVTLLVSATEVLALFAVADSIKPTSREAIATLAGMNVSIVMLTGDNQRTAQTIATQAGISEARGDLLPEDKLIAIRDLRRKGPTAMIGDGINDAPALAESDIGIAMGVAGADIAIESADVVIMNDDLRRIPDVLRLSRQTHAVLWQNIALALGIKVVFLYLAIFDNASMWMAVFADMGASLLVVANGLRLLGRGDTAA
jgi:Cd2+/Zn2+-exporting ATPase